MTEEPVAFIQSLYAAFGRGDVDAIIAGVSPDVRWCSVGRASDFPAYGPRHGHAEVREFFALLGLHIEFQAFEPREFHAVADKVFVLGHSRMAVRRNGRVSDTDWVHVFSLKDGEVTDFKDFSDTAQTAEAFRA